MSALRPPPQYAPLTRAQEVTRGVLVMLLVASVGFLVNLVAYSPLHHAVKQQQLFDEFRHQLAEGTAPVSEGTFEDVLLADGAPVARIQIPALGVDEIIVEGTSSGILMDGPGHRRDSVLPGQRGVSIVMGRMNAYGGPFNRLQELAPGESIRVITGQGEHIFRVLGTRYEGDLAPRFTSGQARLQLVTARGLPYMPSGLVRVDADLVTEVQDPGLRQTGPLALPKPHQALQGDSSTVWALVFALQFLLVAESGVAFMWRRAGRAKMWIVAVPTLLLAGLLVADQVTKLLPNLV